MCTLVFGLGVLAPRSVLVATNRDEDPARGSEPPQVLRRAPLVVGGRDAVAGGTWLALRAGVGAGVGTSAAGTVVPAPPSPATAVALLLNRHDPEPARAGRRSRGLLTLDVAAVADPRATALAEAATGRYAPCSLVWLSGEESWLLAIRAGRAPTLEPIAPGWHAITHFELDDAADARAAWLLAQLAGWRPAARAEAEARLRSLIASHGGPDAPAVCLHAGRAPTVSAALVWLAPGELAYRHAQGPPCVTAFEDWTRLAG
jgi:uncharacterized protein with NRDE domain